MLKYLIFLPSVNFGVLKSEIFPWALLYRISIRIHRLLFLYSAAIIVLSLFLWLFHGVMFPGIVTSLLSLIIGPFLFMTVSKSAGSVDFYKLSRKVFFLLIIVGSIQVSGIISPLLDVIIKLLIPRGEASLIGHGRGITLLDTEPARAGKNLIFIAFLARLSFKNAQVKLCLDVLLTVVVIFWVKSAIAALFLAIYLIIYRMKQMSLIILPLLFYEIVPDSRAGQVFVQLSNTDLLQIKDLLITLSGHRGITLLASSYNSFNLLPYGLGSWSLAISELYPLTGIKASSIPIFSTNFSGNFYPFKPSSYLFFLILELGTYGLLLATLFIFRIVRCIKSKDHFVIISLFLLHFMLLGAVGNPVPWLALAAGLKHSHD